MARTHTKLILDEYLRLFNADLRTTLNLKGVYKGDLSWLPPQTITDMVNGIWVTIEPSLRINRVLLPKELETTYNLRFVYVRRIAVNENPINAKLDDIETITEKLFDKFDLPDLTLTNGQILWSLPNEVEFSPPEDDYIVEIASDLIAMAFRVDTVVRSKR